MTDLRIIEHIRGLFKQKDRIFLIEPQTKRTFTYGDFYNLACRGAFLLYSRGIRQGDRVALVLTNSAEFAALYFSCLFLGAVAVPVNPVLHQRELDFILSHTGLKLIVFSPVTETLVGNSASQMNIPLLSLLPLQEQNRAGEYRPWWSLDRDVAPSIPDWQPLEGMSDRDLLSITFTSGTTNTPKGVAHSIGGLFRNAMAFNAELGFGPNHRVLHVMTMSYMAGFLNTLLCPFIAGASVVLGRAFDSQTALHFWKSVIEYQADTFWLAPTMLEALLRVDRDPYGLQYAQEHVKNICVGTAPLPSKTKRKFEDKYGVSLFESYGLSELLILATNSPNTKKLSNSVGKLLPNIDIKIVNEQGEPITLGDKGEILIKTPYIMIGYLNFQTLQPDYVDSNEWFPTGDIGYLNKDAAIFVTGRKKDLIIRGGINISPRVVEDVLHEHPAIDEVAVIGIPHDFYGEEVVAVVKLYPGYNLNDIQESLKGLCRQDLSINSAPTKYIEFDQLPMSSTGKIQKGKLREWVSVKIKSQESAQG